MRKRYGPRFHYGPLKPLGSTGWRYMIRWDRALDMYATELQPPDRPDTTHIARGPLDARLDNMWSPGVEIEVDYD